MKKLLLISIIFLASCNGMYEEKQCPTDTVYLPAQLNYGVENKDRGFGGSPDVWAAGLPVTDSTGKTRRWLFTESDIERMNIRADNNLNDK